MIKFHINRIDTYASIKVETWDTTVEIGLLDEAEIQQFVNRLDDAKYELEEIQARIDDLEERKQNLRVMEDS